MIGQYQNKDCLETRGETADTCATRCPGSNSGDLREPPAREKLHSPNLPSHRKPCRSPYFKASEKVSRFNKYGLWAPSRLCCSPKGGIARSYGSILSNRSLPSPMISGCSSLRRTRSRKRRGSPVISSGISARTMTRGPEDRNAGRRRAFRAASVSVGSQEEWSPSPHSTSRRDSRGKLCLGAERRVIF